MNPPPSGLYHSAKATVIIINSKEMYRNIFLKTLSYDVSYVYDTAVH